MARAYGSFDFEDGFFDLVVEIDEPLYEYHVAPVSPKHEGQTRATAPSRPSTLPCSR